MIPARLLIFASPPKRRIVHGFLWFLGAALISFLSSHNASAQQAPPPPVAGEPLAPQAETADALPIEAPAYRAPAFLKAGIDCRAHARRGEYSRAILCAERALKKEAPAPALALQASSLEQLGRFDEANTLWRRYADKTRSQANLEATRRQNALAALQEIIAATARGRARKMIRRLSSITQTIKRQASMPQLRRLPRSAYFDLQRGWILRAARKKRPAVAAWKRAERGKGEASQLASICLQRLLNRRASKGLWPLTERSFGGPGRDEITALARLPNGSLLLAGSQQVEGEDAEQLQIWGVDGDGRMRWAQAFGSRDRDVATTLALTPNGGAILAGETTGADGKPDLFVVHFARNHSVRWHRTWPSLGPDHCVGLRCQPDATCLLIANREPNDAPPGVDVLSVSLRGQQGKPRRLPDSDQAIASAVCETSSGAAIAGWTPAPRSQGVVGRVWRLGADGSPLGSFSLHRWRDSRLRAITSTGKKGLLAVGSLPSPPETRHHKPRRGRRGRKTRRAHQPASEGRALVLLQLDRRDKVKWLKTWTGLRDPRPSAVVNLGRSGCAVALSGQDPRQPGSVWTVGFDRRGRERWRAPLRASRGDRPTAMIRNGRRGLIVVGQTSTGGRGEGDGWLALLGK